MSYEPTSGVTLVPQLTLENLFTKEITVLDDNNTYDLGSNSDGVLFVRPNSTERDDGERFAASLYIRANLVLCRANTPLWLKPPPLTGHYDSAVTVVDPVDGGPASVALRADDTFYFSDKRRAMRLKVIMRSSADANASTEEIQVTSSSRRETEPAGQSFDEQQHEHGAPSVPHVNTSRTPLASFSRVETIAETPATGEGRFRDVTISEIPNGPNGDRPTATVSTEASDINKTPRVPLNQRVRTVVASDGETTDDEESESESEAESEQNGKGLHRGKPSVVNNGTSTPSEDLFSTPMDNQDRADVVKADAKTVIVEISQNVEPVSKRPITDEDETEQPQKKKRSSQASNDDSPRSENAPQKRGVGRPKKTPTSKTATAVKTPSSSKQASTRTTPVVTDTEKYRGPPPRVAFSSQSKVLSTPAHKKFLTSAKCKIVNNAIDEDFDVFCTGNDGLKKTGQLLMSVALGRHLVTDEWVTESSKAGYLLPVDAFLPEDPEHEAEWGIRIAGVAGRCRTGLFEDKTFYITPAAKKAYGPGFKEIQKILCTAGAEEVISGSHRDLDEENDYCVIVNEKSDYDAPALKEAGYKLFNRDLISFSILRGKVDFTSPEFLVEPQGPKKSGKKSRSST